MCVSYYCLIDVAVISQLTFLYIIFQKTHNNQDCLYKLMQEVLQELGTMAMSRMGMSIMPTIRMVMSRMVMSRMAMTRMAMTSIMAHEQDFHEHHDHEQHS